MNQLIERIQMDMVYAEADFFTALGEFLRSLQQSDQAANLVGGGYCVAADSEIHFNSVHGTGIRAVISRDDDYWDVRLEYLPEVDLP